MFAGTASVSWREMRLHLIDPVPPLPHGRRNNARRHYLSANAILPHVQNKPCDFNPHRHRGNQHKYKTARSKGKDNNSYLAEVMQMQGRVKESMLARANVRLSARKIQQN